jgi:phosphatidylserine/phosphatidylglycerophosphate/cardiolipin synthase-like enzyme
LHLCFSPHRAAELSLNPVGAAIDQASSSVLYSIAFLNQIETGPTRATLERLMQRSVFSYGVVNEASGLEVRKPDGSIGVVDFAFLAKNAPEPFKSEWSGGKGINVHHKFVVTDFSLPSAKVFSGSSNLAPSGEKGNGDNLVMIDDQRVATGYAIEALRIFDHLHFRTVMQAAAPARPVARATTPSALTLRKPTAISGRPAWFEAYYRPGSQRETDRKLFSK